MIEKLEGTVGVKYVSIEEFIDAYLDNRYRGYNTSALHFVDGNLVLSAPLNNTGYHYTLVLTKDMILECSLENDYVLALHWFYDYLFVSHEEFLRKKHIRDFKYKLEKLDMKDWLD